MSRQSRGGTAPGPGDEMMARKSQDGRMAVPPGFETQRILVF